MYDRCINFQWCSDTTLESLTEVSAEVAGAVMYAAWSLRQKDRAFFHRNEEEFPSGSGGIVCPSGPVFVQGELQMVDFLNLIDGYVWGPPLLILLVGTGIFLTLRTGFVQVLRLPLAFKLIFSTGKNQDAGDVSSFKSLCTALAATVGTGNIVGVATAIHAGGPGALFWMWMAAFFGMATKFSEGTLAVRYREVDANGNIAGGPMFYIKNGMGMKWKWLGGLFAFFGTFAAIFGIGNTTQVNSIVEVVKVAFGVDVIWTAIILFVLVTAIIFGGLQTIAETSSKIVPAMAVIYLVTTVSILLMFADNIPAAVALVIDNAFTGTAATGGFLGASVMMAMQSGIARGLFSNEAGLGSAPIVAAAAKTRWPAEQGLVSMTGTFIDTIIICTLTGLTIIVTGQWSADLNGAALTNAAFSMAYPTLGGALLTISLVLFAFTTVLGWNYYGERCLVYLVGTKWIKPYRVVFVIMTLVGCFMKLDAIWALADILNALMAIPNLIALLCLSGVVSKELRAFIRYRKTGEEYDRSAD